MLSGKAKQTLNVQRSTLKSEGRLVQGKPLGDSSDLVNWRYCNSRLQAFTASFKTKKVKA